MRIRDWSSDVCSSDLSDYPLSSPLDELSEWQRVVRPLRVSADGYLRLATNRLSVDSDYTWEMHRHSDYELLWAIDGVLEVRTPETVYTVPSGVSLWIPSYVPHEVTRSEEHTSELQSLMRNSYAFFCLKK